jgi:type II secretory pathway component PulL
LVELERVVRRGLFATQRFWAPLQTAQSWLVRAAEVLANEEKASAVRVEEKYRELLEEVLKAKGDESVAAWATTFYKVTRSYWRGLFHCYDRLEMPRTNNELEQYFGRARHHERRATGHKRPTSALVVRGSVRLVAAVATQVKEWSGQALRPSSVEAWRQLRKALEVRHELRRASRRFRKAPDHYLAQLESQLLP